MFNSRYLNADWRSAPMRPIRDGFGEGLVSIGHDERVVVLTADLAESTRVEQFAKKWPERFFDVGVAEQNMAGVAAGMALSNYKPYISSYAAFSPGRNLDQIRVSIALTRANVKILSSHGGVATGMNGPSHQALEDVAIMRVIPNMRVLVPPDASSCAQTIVQSVAFDGPCYIRAARPENRDFLKTTEFSLNKARVLREAQETRKMVTIVSCGVPVWETLVASERLAMQGVECEVIEATSIKPIDEESIVESAKKTGRVVSVEDHQVAGGLGGAIAELLSKVCPVPLTSIGIEDQFGVAGEYPDLYRKYGLDAGGIYERVLGLW